MGFRGTEEVLHGRGIGMLTIAITDCPKAGLLRLLKLLLSQKLQWHIAERRLQLEATPLAVLVKTLLSNSTAAATLKG